MRKKTYETPTTTCTLVVSENAIMDASARLMNDGITIQTTNAEGTAGDDLFNETVFTSSTY